MNDLRQIEGKQIRMQYFNIMLYLISACITPLLIINIYNVIQGDRFSPYSLRGFWLVLCIVFIALVILSLLNRFYFGKTICVLDQNGIHHKDGFIDWDLIERIDYEIDIPRKGSFYKNCCHANVYTKQTCIVIKHAPFYLISSVKKMRPSIPASLSKHSIFMLGLYAIFIIIADFIIIEN